MGRKPKTPASIAGAVVGGTNSRKSVKGTDRSHVLAILGYLGRLLGSH